MCGNDFFVLLAGKAGSAESSEQSREVRPNCCAGTVALFAGKAIEHCFWLQAIFAKLDIFVSKCTFVLLLAINCCFLQQANNNC